MTVSSVIEVSNKHCSASTLAQNGVPPMKDTSKARYAVAALVDLARQPAHQPTTLAAIASRQGISVSYLEQVFARLRAAGLVKSMRGPGGGYVLARPSYDIAIADIYGAVFELNENGAHVTPAEGAGLRAQMDGLWQAMEREVARYLQSVTVHDVACGKLGPAKGRQPAA